MHLKKDVCSELEISGESDSRMLNFFVPKKYLCKSGDESDIYAIGFMRGVVAGVEQRDLVAERRGQHHDGIRKYADVLSRLDGAAPLGGTATETPRFEGRGSQPPALQ
jgi:hypothetical protein